MDYPPSSPSFATDNDNSVSSKRRTTSAGEKSGRDSGGSRRGVRFTPSKELVSAKYYGTPPSSRASQRLDDSDKLQDQIGLQHLVELMRVFNEADERGRGEGLDIEEFQAAFGQILGGKNIEEQMAVLFMKIDSTNDGTIDWDEFCTYMLLEFEERDLMMGDKLPPFPYDLKNIPSTVSAYREPFSRIAFLPNIGRGGGGGSDSNLVGSLDRERDGAILTVNRDGLLCFWKSNMVLQKTVNLADGSRSKMIWVTDMAVMPNIHKLVLGFTDGMLAVYDLSTPGFDKLFQITGLYHCPMALHHWYDDKDHNHSILLFGDSGGGLCMMEFTRATRTLFGIATAGEQKCNVISFEQIIHHKLNDMKSIYFSQVHCDWVNDVRYWECADSIFSCCSHSNCSLIINSVTGRKENVVFKVRKGIASFDFSQYWNMIATGGIDRIVRLWNPYVATKPISVLRGHNAGIIHVVINHLDGHILSFSKDLELRVWDISDHLCLQVCPRFHVLGQHLPYGFYFHASTGTLLIANNHLWSLQQYREDSVTSTEVTTHDKPLCAALYSDNFSEVVSACHGSVVSVWDLETGEKTIQFSKCHDEVEITAMAFDPSRRRLVTGGRDGSVKLWNFNNGACLLTFKSLYSTEVTSICFLNQKIIASGWNRRLSIYRDFHEPDDVTPKYCGEGVHSDDILCMAHQSPNLLATASYDGDIVIWNSDVEQVVSHLNTTAGVKGAQQYRLRNLLLTSRKKNRIRGTQKQKELISEPIKGACVNARFGYNDNTAVEQVVFLPNREQSTTSATLVAGGAGGMIQFWNVYGSGLLGQFNVFTSAAESKLTWKKDEEDLKTLHAITALKVDSVSNFLISGTSLGYLQIWDISDYCVSVSEPTPLNEAPPSVLCWRAHLTTVVSIDLAEDKGLIVTASTDCCVRLWTMQGRYIGTFGDKQLWKLSHPIVPADLPRKIPPSLHKSASFKTMQTVAGPCKTKWSLARDLFKVLRRNRLRTKKQKNGDQLTDPDFDHLSSSEILGDAYQRKSRVRQPLEPTKLQLCDGYPVGIYASLKCSELQDCEESHTQLLAQLQLQDNTKDESSTSDSEDEEENGRNDCDSQLKKPYTEISLFPDMATADSPT